ncbi:hypothetical protein L596_015588 [Steinernema carpocapsae]|uniref:Cystatin domain-containing protein n=1 Tax=Steinernema carpocapsae TaxID=34508 RepID=A0A4V6XW88_STECR|nr:hypothetical protein L596_015588 [Steinernema carpocapsae]
MNISILIAIAFLKGNFAYRLKNFGLEESDFVPRVCAEKIDNDNPFIYEAMWKSAKEINDKFDDKFLLLPLKSIHAKRNVCVAGHEYLLEFDLFQSDYAKVDLTLEEARELTLELSENSPVLRCKTNLYKDPFADKEQVVIDRCRNVY